MENVVPSKDFIKEYFKNIQPCLWQNKAETLKAT